MEVVRVGRDNKKEYAAYIEALLGERYKEQELTGLECFVLEDEEAEETAGFIAVDVTDQLPIIEMIYVLPHQRYIGCGTMLLNAAELAMRTNGAEGIGAVLYMDMNNKKNEYDFPGEYVKEFFEKRGYMLVPLEDEDITENMGDEDITENMEMIYASKEL